jgi:hypothetical protein
VRIDPVRVHGDDRVRLSAGADRPSDAGHRLRRSARRAAGTAGGHVGERQVAGPGA